jgi:hypothetical protein
LPKFKFPGTYDGDITIIARYSSTDVGTLTATNTTPGTTVLYASVTENKKTWGDRTVSFDYTATGMGENATTNMTATQHGYDISFTKPGTIESKAGATLSVSIGSTNGLPATTYLRAFKTNSTAGTVVGATSSSFSSVTPSSKTITFNDAQFKDYEGTIYIYGYDSENRTYSLDYTTTTVSKPTAATNYGYLYCTNVFSPTNVANYTPTSLTASDQALINDLATNYSKIKKLGGTETLTGTSTLYLRTDASMLNSYSRITLPSSTVTSSTNVNTIAGFRLYKSN